jgi:hypothetical protein
MDDDSGTLKRTFTFSEAAALLPEVRRLTGEAHARIEVIHARHERGEQAEALQAEADAVYQAWADSMRERGIEVKGLWLIDFDNGSGYYCWVWPEAKLEYYHSYEAGFRGRMRIH